MKARMRLEHPDDVEVTLVITMKARDWCELRDQLVSSWPSWKLSSIISELLGQVRKIVWEEASLGG